MIKFNLVAPPFHTQKGGNRSLNTEELPAVYLYAESLDLACQVAPSEQQLLLAHAIYRTHAEPLRISMNEEMRPCERRWVNGIIHGITRGHPHESELDRAALAGQAGMHAYMEGPIGENLPEIEGVDSGHFEYIYEKRRGFFRNTVAHRLACAITHPKQHACGAGTLTTRCKKAADAIASRMIQLRRCWH